MSQQELYVGLDVSLETTSICVVDHDGSTVWRGSCPTDAAIITKTIRLRAANAVRVGLETGQMSNWLTLSLRPRATRHLSRCAPRQTGAQNASQ
jgi:hypothetical protein